MKKRLGSISVATVVVLLAWVTANAGPHNVVPLDLPQVPVPDGLTRKEIHKAVLMAAVIRDWRVTNDNTQARYIDAEFPIRVHVARVRIDYSTSPITFEYRESDNLKHGWKKLDNQGNKQERAWANLATGEQPWTLSPTPKGTTGTEMIHAKYNIWVGEVARTLDGTLRLATLE